MVSTWEDVSVNKKSADGRFSESASVVKKWCPYESLIVSIPVELTVGVTL